MINIFFLLYFCLVISGDSLPFTGGLWSVLMLGFGGKHKKPEDETNDAILANQSLLFILILANHCTNEKGLHNPYREALFSFTNSQGQYVTKMFRNWNVFKCIWFVIRVFLFLQIFIRFFLKYSKMECLYSIKNLIIHSLLCKVCYNYHFIFSLRINISCLFTLMFGICKPCSGTRLHINIILSSYKCFT